MTRLVPTLLILLALTFFVDFTDGSNTSVPVESRVDTSTPAGMKLETRVGMPIPRFP